MTLNEFQRKPALTADGRKWCQRCYLCNKAVNFLKTVPQQRVIVGNLVRHEKCRPEPIR